MRIFIRLARYFGKPVIIYFGQWADTEAAIRLSVPASEFIYTRSLRTLVGSSISSRASSFIPEVAYCINKGETAIIARDVFSAKTVNAALRSEGFRTIMRAAHSLDDHWLPGL